MSAVVVRADALTLPIATGSVDLIVTSPPYFALRSYQDGGEHYDGQIGSEPTPEDFLEALSAVTAECWRVLKPTGSMFVNLGDKYAGSGGHNNAGISAKSTLTGGLRKLQDDDARRQPAATRRGAPDRYNQASGNVRAKSLMGLPWRYAIGCIDAGWILRAEIVWNKPNGLPESVTDRVRRSHEQWFHLVKSGRYFSAVDELREPHASFSGFVGHDDGRRNIANDELLGRLPGSVWTIPSEPLIVPPAIGVDHFAAFPQEWPRRLILGWSPHAVCTACGEGRRPVVERDTSAIDREKMARIVQSETARTLSIDSPKHSPSSYLGQTDKVVRSRAGYECACADTSATSAAGVVLDPFGGTGTTAMVAQALGRVGISVDLSADYCRLAQWRIIHSDHDLKAVARTEGAAVADSVRDRREKRRAGYVEMFPNEDARA